ncbi:MAG TPA: hypothetical protein VL284_19340 [Thermoanaerobaculia bacterium]|nr:hypothetical protein [Thermoanaerobaculia bacterium]
MRKAIFWTGWGILFLLPIAFLAEVVIEQDLPAMPPWKLVIPIVGVALTIIGRNRDDVLKHHIG